MQVYASYLIPLSVGMLRPMGILVVFPVFSTGNLGSTMVRTAVCLMLALPALPLLDRPGILPDPASFGFLLLCITELLIGLLIGVLVSVPFWAIDGAGNIMDVMGGTEMSSLYNPSLGTQSSQMATLFSKLLSALFFTSGAWQTMLRAMYQTYIDLPVNHQFQLATSGIHFMVTICSATLTLAVQFALPAILVMFLIDFAFGFLNRAVRQMDVFFLSMPVKSIMGGFIVVVSLVYCLQPYLEDFGKIAQQVHQLISFLQ